MFQEAFPTPGDIFRPFFVSEARSYISTCIFIQEPTEEQLRSAHGAVWEHFVTDSSSGCLSQPAGSGSKTRFWFRPEAQCALVPQLEYLSFFSSGIHAEAPWLQAGLALCVGGTCPQDFLVSGGWWNWCSDYI